MQTLTASRCQAVRQTQHPAVHGRAASGCLLAVRGRAATAASRAACLDAGAARRAAAVQHGCSAPAGRRRSCVCAAAPGESPAPADDDDVTYEPMRKTRAKGKLQAKVKVSTPTVDAALGNAPPSELARNETTAVLLLTAVFLAIMVEGLLVASSGFMSEQWDGFVQANVLPVFAPTLGLFLAGSSAYGVWKAYGKQV